MIVSLEDKQGAAVVSGPPTAYITGKLPVIKIKGINSEIQLEREIKCLQKCLQTTKLETFAMFALSVV